MKVCSKCGSYKPWDCFYKNSRYTDGYQGVCRECQNKRMRELERSGARYLIVKKYREKYKALYPEKLKCRSVVAHAIASGKLMRGSCDVCGQSDAEAHHEDYSKPLDIRWLCGKHHREHHNGGY